MATALRDESWDRIENQDWFRSAQVMATENRFFHWELEFPVVYYGDDGNRKISAGFDAVIGNPPWVATAGRADISANIDTDLRSYLSSSFDATKDQFDLYVAFYEQSIRQSQKGQVGIIVPDAILTREQNEPIREFVLTNSTLSRIVRVGTAFEGVETGAVILVSSGESDEIKCADATTTTELNSLDYNSIPVDVFKNQDAKRFLIYLDEATRSVLSKVETHPPLRNKIDISRGEEISKRADFLHQQPRSDTRPIAPGGAVIQYGIDEDELRYIDTDDVEKSQEQYQSPKLIFRQTSDSLIGTYDEEDLVTIKSAYNLNSSSGSNTELKHILGILNSSLLNFYHHYKHAAYRSVFPQINQSTFEAFPIAMEDGADEVIVGAVNKQLNLTAERSKINLQIADYLGNYNDGMALNNLSECQPESGVSNTILTSTTEEWPNLKIGSVSVASTRGSTTISLTARYKPENESIETDRWGYTETEPIVAIRTIGTECCTVSNGPSRRNLRRRTPRRA
ncbi:Eco57I restriction-modification methylase, partial [Halopenitus malekzadehii]